MSNENKAGVDLCNSPAPSGLRCIKARDHRGPCDVGRASATPSSKDAGDEPAPCEDHPALTAALAGMLEPSGWVKYRQGDDLAFDAEDIGIIFRAGLSAGAAAPSAEQAPVMRLLSAGLPPPEDYDRVLVYTDGVDFNGDQYFDINTEYLWESDPDMRTEVADAATHWMPLPRPGSSLSAGAAAKTEQAPGQWVRCTPYLLKAGVSCANTPRRAGDGTYSHDHFIAHGAASAAGAGSEQPGADTEPNNDEFARGVIAALGVLATGHGYKHGSVYHDEIVRSVGESVIYAAAEDEDYEWAGLDQNKKPALAQQAAPEAPATTASAHHFACERKGHNPLCAGCEAETLARAPLPAQADKHCPLPPDGWHCTRPAGHEGPCAAWPEGGAV